VIRFGQLMRPGFCTASVIVLRLRNEALAWREVARWRQVLKMAGNLAAKRGRIKRTSAAPAWTSPERQ
jgi:hypothetical protein